MSFGAEFRNMRAAGGAPKISETVSKEAEAAATEKASAAPAENDPDAETFQQPFADGQTLGDPGDEEIEAPPVIPPPKSEAKKVPVKIGDKKFDTVEEAMDYATLLDRELEKKEAFEKGLESAKPKEAKPAEVKKIKKIADKLFENPEEAMEELEAHFSEMADRRLEAREAQKTDTEVRAQKMKEDTDNFYKNNADLADWQVEVDSVVKANWNTLVKLPKEEIMTEAARLAREYVASVKERALPKSNLQSRTAQTSSSGSRSATATEKPTTEKKMSFASQVRSTNRRTTAQSEI